MLIYYLYYSVTINESKEKFKIVFCCFLTIKSIIAPSSSNFPGKSTGWGKLGFVCPGKSIPISYEMKIQWYEKSNEFPVV